MKAIISDIHGNLEGLQAVLADIEAQQIDEIDCLGDIVGYGPNPSECIDLVMQRCAFCLLGNHDQAALFDPEGFNIGAERAILWTRKMLESAGPKASERYWEFLGELPRVKREGAVMYVHGSARNPLNEYVFPEDIYNQRKMERIFGLVEKYCFQGHTHIPGVFTESLDFLAPEDLEYEYILADEKVLINVGSVGQPRDGDSRACYVIIEPAEPSAGESETSGESGLIGTGSRVRFRRVDYDFESTARKIYEVPDLDDFLGDRLRDGR